MPQEIRILRCFKCNTFQTDIVKKAKKWTCKVCNAKQSVFKEFFRGTGADCRQKVQELNYNAKIEENELENTYLDLLDQNDFNIEFEYVDNDEHESNGQNGSILKRKSDGGTVTPLKVKNFKY